MLFKTILPHIPLDYLSQHLGGEKELNAIPQPKYFKPNCLREGIHINRFGRLFPGLSPGLSDLHHKLKHSQALPCRLK
jgi:hypothetical protein